MIEGTEGTEGTDVDLNCSLALDEIRLVGCLARL